MGSWFSVEWIKGNDIHVRIDEHVRQSLTNASDSGVPLFFGLYSRPSIFAHQVVIISYVVRVGDDPVGGIFATDQSRPPEVLVICPRCLSEHSATAQCPSLPSSSSDLIGRVRDPPSGIEIRSVVIELFLDMAAGQKVLQMSRFLSPRDGYEISDFCFLNDVSLKSILKEAHTIFANTSGYQLVWNNCHHFSKALFYHLRRFPSHSLHLPAKVLRRYWRRFPPAYLERTRENSYLDFAELIRLYPTDHPALQCTPSGGFDIRANFAQFLLGIYSHQVVREDLQIGDVLSVEMPNQKPFHHFIVVLGSRVDFLKLLKDNIYLIQEHSRPKVLAAQLENLIEALENSTAMFLHFDHNGKRVAIRDFDQHFYGLYPGPFYKVDSLPNREKELVSIPKMTRQDQLQGFLLRILPLIGLPVFDSKMTCTCVAAAAHGIDVQQDPQIPLGVLGAALFDKYLANPQELQIIPDNSIFGNMMISPESRMNQVNNEIV